MQYFTNILHNMISIQMNKTIINKRLTHLCKSKDYEKIYLGGGAFFYRNVYRYISRVPFSAHRIVKIMSFLNSGVFRIFNISPM